MNSPTFHFDVSQLSWNNLVLLISDSHYPSDNVRLTQGCISHQMFIPKRFYMFSDPLSLSNLKRQLCCEVPSRHPGFTLLPFLQVSSAPLSS